MTNSILFTHEPLHNFDNEIIFEEDLESHVNGCEDENEIGTECDGNDDDNDLYDLSNYSYNRKAKPTYPVIRRVPHTPEYYLQKAAYAYDNFKYKKCLEYIDLYETRINQPTYERTIIEKVVGLTYRAYCKKNLKKYSSAKDYFREIISLMKKAEFNPECLFTTYFQHATCYAHLGRMDECKERLEKLAKLDIGLDINTLAKNDYMICHQPCFHYHKLSTYDKLVINEVVATALGNDIIALQKEGKLIPTNCLCSNTNEAIESCAANCERIGALASISAAYIPGGFTRAVVLYAIVEFIIACPKCCEEGLGSENCCRGLKSVLQRIFEGVAKVNV